MTPKEKAEELASKYQSSYQTNDGFNYQFNIDESEAKHCALISVDEILAQINNWGIISVKKYWEEVKKELEYI